MKTATSSWTNISRTRLVLLHVALWVCFLFFPLLIYKVDFFNVRFFERDLVNNLFLILLFYFNFYYLIPRYFVRKKLAVYFTLVFVCILIFVMQQLVVEYLFMPFHGNINASRSGLQAHSQFDRNSPFHHNIPFADSLHDHTPFLDERGNNHPPDFFNMPAFFWIDGFRRALLSILTILLTGGFIRSALQWFKTEKRNEELEVKRLNVELDLLKAQINPHFLFNSLNTIYSLAHKQSQQTQEVILKLSDILRYVIYESSARKVMLERELSYIDNYIDLQKYRLDNNISVQYRQTGEAAGLEIEPMLLIPFIENAFKHGISYLEGSFIKIDIEIEKNELTMRVSNSYKETDEPNKQTGIGLENVKKRLELGYQHQHQLDITNDKGIYTVHLILML